MTDPGVYAGSGLRRLLILGDGLPKTSGFARNLREIVASADLHERYEVGQLAALDTPPFLDSQFYRDLNVEPFFPDAADNLGLRHVPAVIRAFDPHLIFFHGDPGTYAIYQEVLAQAGAGDIPRACYVPVEGAPIPEPHARAIRTSAAGLTYTEWGSQRLHEEWSINVGWQYHGVDRATFYPRGDREALRRDYGWSDRFVVGYVARNQYRKAQDKMIAAARHLKAAGLGDRVHFYLHCHPNEHGWNGGWDLRWLAHTMGVAEMITFGLDAHETGITGMGDTALARRYAALDAYIHPAMIEGFGLPLIEAMACGVPVLCTYDGGAMVEVCGGGDISTSGATGFLIPSDTPTWHTGARMHAVESGTIAEAVRMLILARDYPINPEDPSGPTGWEARIEPGIARGLARVAEPEFRWSRLRQTIVALLRFAEDGPNELPPLAPDLDLAWPRPDADFILQDTEYREPEPRTQAAGAAAASEGGGS